MKDKTFHFISGLPRAGSTLLSAILKQNPAFHANVSSPALPLLCDMQNHLSARNEYRAFLDSSRRREILISAFLGYYYDLHRHEVIFDTHRGWCGHMGLIGSLFPNAKVVCCVRSLPHIFASFVRVTRSNPFDPPALFDYKVNSNLYQRVESLARLDGPVGGAYANLKDAFFGPWANKLILLPYDALVSHPKKTIGELYTAINEEYFDHDFDNVSYNSTSYDCDIGMPGLHNINGCVKKTVRHIHLPPDLVAKYVKGNFWELPKYYSKDGPIIIGRGGH